MEQLFDEDLAGGFRHSVAQNPFVLISIRAGVVDLLGCFSFRADSCDRAVI